MSTKCDRLVFSNFTPGTAPNGLNRSGQKNTEFEPYVDADTVATFLAVKRKTILDWARKEIIPAHPFGRGKRIVWRFRLSEIARHKRPVESTIGTGSPEIARLEKKRG
jgi:hypothetical protein